MAKKKETTQKKRPVKKGPAKKTGVKKAKAPARSKAVKTAVKKPARSTAKKTTQRAPKKKTLAPKTTKKTVASKRKKVVKAPLVYAPDWQIFYAVNGAALRSLSDLYYELETMLEEQYAYHKESGDHFSIWVREVLCDDACAAALTNANTRRKARAVLKRHLAFYEF